MPGAKRATGQTDENSFQNFEGVSGRLCGGIGSPGATRGGGSQRYGLQRVEGGSPTIKRESAKTGANARGRPEAARAGPAKNPATARAGRTNAKGSHHGARESRN